MKVFVDETIRARMRFAWITTGAAIAVYSLVMWNWLSGAPACGGCLFLRSGSAVVDAAVDLAAQLIPLVAFLLVLISGRRKARWIGMVLLAPFVLASAISAVIATVNLDGVRYGSSGVLDPLQQVDAGPDQLTLYRTNGGAMTSYGILLRRERRVLPGLTVVRNVRNWYPADTGVITRSSATTVHVHVVGRSGGDTVIVVAQ